MTRSNSATVTTTRSTVVLNAPPQCVWQFLLDIPRSTACLPGVRNVREVDEHTYRGEVYFRVGPLAFHFDTTVFLTEITPPLRLALRAQATDPLTGQMLTATAAAELSQADQNRTLLHYELQVSTPGLLAGLGHRIFQDLNRQMVSQFLECVERELATAGDSFTAQEPTDR